MSLCSECAAIQLTCCCKERRDILLTQGDIARITRTIEHQDFWEYRQPGDPIYSEQDDDPNWIVYTVRADGTRKVLKKTAEQTCLFLTQTGCFLSEEVRPLVCRMYPFNYTEQGLQGIEAECPVHLLPPGTNLLDVLGMSAEKAAQWREMLYDELRTQGEHLHESRTNV